MAYKNNFGFLRLLFAGLVIVSHSPELIDGNRSREILTSLFGTLSLGELAVDGFFLISGYLVLKSYLNSRSRGHYLLKRVLRVYPGFLAAYCVSIIVVGPLAGARLADLSWPEIVKAVVLGALLLPPYLPDAFAGLPYPGLNGAMWTIAYEFRCYLLVLGLGALGVYDRKWILAVITSLLLAGVALHLDLAVSNRVGMLLGTPHESIRLAALFCTGSVFYLFRLHIPWRRSVALIAAGGLIVMMYSPIAAEVAAALCGGYLVFWIALHVGSAVLARINSENDISYGVYLYGWPVQESLIYAFDGISPWLVTTITLPVVALMGWASWTFVERPFLLFKNSRWSVATSPV